MNTCMGCPYCRLFSADGYTLKYQCTNKESQYYRAIFSGNGWGCEKHS